MGEYWKPVNLTRGEFIHPHAQNCGLKLGEWNYPESPVRKLMRARWSSTDDIRALSDYGGELQLSGHGDAPSPDYEVIEERFVEIGLGERSEEPPSTNAVDPVDGVGQEAATRDKDSSS